MHDISPIDGVKVMNATISLAADPHPIDIHVIGRASAAKRGHIGRHHIGRRHIHSIVSAVPSEVIKSGRARMPAQGTRHRNRGRVMQDALQVHAM